MNLSRPSLSWNHLRERNDFKTYLSERMFDGYLVELCPWNHYLRPRDSGIDIKLNLDWTHCFVQIFRFF